MNLQNSLIVENISSLLEMARKCVAFSVNHTMVLTYFEIGKIIVEEEQNGQHRAEYGKFLLKTLSKELTKRFGKGFSQRNLEQIRQFYLTYSNQISQTLSVKSEKPQIPQTLSAKSENLSISLPTQRPDFKLSWSHYLKLMRIKDENQWRGRNSQNAVCVFDKQEGQKIGDLVNVFVYDNTQGTLIGRIE